VSTIYDNGDAILRPTAIDLFCGVGGLSLGLEQAGFNVIGAVDIDPVHCACHSFNFPNCTTICSDITELTADKLLDNLRCGKTKVDLIAGGAPCQGFSLIGKRALDDPRNSLVKDFARIVLAIRPKYFLFENVKGMAVGEQRGILTELIETFRTNGYRVKEPHRILNAVEYGVPQDRRRLFLIGARRDQILPNYPQPITQPRANNINGYDLLLPLSPSVDDAISDILHVDGYPELVDQDWVKVEYGDASDYSSILRGEELDKNDVSFTRKWDSSIITSSLLTEHSKKSTDRFKKTLPGKVEPISRFYKLKSDGVSNTLRAGTGSNRGGYTAPRPIHPSKPRCITVREAARLHSYPDWFRFHFTKWHGFRQIGNSVPPLLGRALASMYIEAMGIKVKKPRKKIALGNESHLYSTMSESAKFFNVNPDIVGKRTK